MFLIVVVSGILYAVAGLTVLLSFIFLMSVLNRQCCANNKTCCLVGCVPLVFFVFSIAFGKLFLLLSATTCHKMPFVGIRWQNSFFMYCEFWFTFFVFGQVFICQLLSFTEAWIRGASVGPEFSVIWAVALHAGPVEYNAHVGCSQMQVRASWSYVYVDRTVFNVPKGFLSEVPYDQSMISANILRCISVCCTQKCRHPQSGLPLLPTCQLAEMRRFLKPHLGISCVWEVDFHNSQVLCTRVSIQTHKALANMFETV